MVPSPIQITMQIVWKLVRLFRQGPLSQKKNAQQTHKVSGNKARKLKQTEFLRLWFDYKEFKYVLLVGTYRINCYRLLQSPINLVVIIIIVIHGYRWKFVPTSEMAEPNFATWRAQGIMSLCSHVYWHLLASKVGGGGYLIMNWIECGRKRSHLNMEYYLGICMEELATITKFLSQDIRCPGKESNPAPSEQKWGASLLWIHLVLDREFTMWTR
jgi:hypothetical protein